MSENWQLQEDLIYYEDQGAYTMNDFGLLNGELNKRLLIAIDYNFAPEFASRSMEVMQAIDEEIKRIDLTRLSEETRCIMVAILNQ